MIYACAWCGWLYTERWLTERLGYVPERIECRVCRDGTPLVPVTEKFEGTFYAFKPYNRTGPVAHPLRALERQGSTDLYFLTNDYEAVPLWTQEQAKKVLDLFNAGCWKFRFLPTKAGYVIKCAGKEVPPDSEYHALRREAKEITRRAGYR